MKSKLKFITIIFFITIFTQCKKDEPIILIVTPNYLDFGSLIDSKSILISNGGNTDLTYNITTSDDWINVSNENGYLAGLEDEIVTITINRDNLQLEEYSANLLVKTNKGNSKIVSITLNNTSPYPILTTGIISDKTDISVEITNSKIHIDNDINVSNNEEFTVSQHGHCWSITNPTPTINDTKSELGLAHINGLYDYSFGENIIDLEIDTKYYYRAYAIKNGHVGYGQVNTFSTYYCYGKCLLKIETNANTCSNEIYPVEVWVNDLYFGQISSSQDIVDCYVRYSHNRIYATTNNNHYWDFTCNVYDYSYFTQYLSCSKLKKIN